MSSPPARPRVRRSPASYAQHHANLVMQAHMFKSQEQIAGRYSVGKLLMLREYEKSASFMRVVAVLLLSLLPAVVTVLGLEMLPLGDPRDGWRANGSSMARSCVAHGVLTFSFLLASKQALQLSDPTYSVARIGLISVVTSLVLEGIWLLAAAYWRYPVPLREIIGMVPWLVIVTLSHVVLAKRVLTVYWKRITKYVPVLGAELLLFYLFLALIIGFARLPGALQIATVLSFPIIKVVVKKWLWLYAKNVPDLTTMVTICMVEIAGALYQTLCLQFANSVELSALIMMMDLLQIALEIRMYLGDEGLYDTTQHLRPALQLVETAALQAREPTTADAARAVSRRWGASASRSILVLGGSPGPHLASVVPLPPVTEPLLRGLGSQEGNMVDRVMLPKVDAAQMYAVERALHRLFSCEVLVFVEYMEIFVPVVYSLYVICARSSPSVRYNLILSSMDDATARTTVSNALTYALLEALSFFIMCWFMKAKYGISPLHQLAFVLEHYWMTLQGKLVGSFVTIACYVTMHQGIDFSLEFDYQKLLSGKPQ